MVVISFNPGIHEYLAIDTMCQDAHQVFVDGFKYRRHSAATWQSRLVSGRELTGGHSRFED